MPDGKMPGLRKWKKLPLRQRAQLWATIRLLGDFGECRNEERFKHEQDAIYAIKGWKIRLYCFMARDKRIVLANVEPKKRQRARKEDLKRAERIRAQCVNG